MTVEKAYELLTSQSEGDNVLGQDPETGRTIVARVGRYGPYVTELIEDEDAPKTAVEERAEQAAPKKRTAKKAAKVKPRTGSLFKDMSVETVTLEQALQLLSLPRVVGADPETGDEITAQNGRYGPYLKKGTDSRSLESEDQIFSITLPEVLAIYAQPKTRRGQVAKPPLKELGPDPESGSRSSSRTAASARTRPTARPTPRCARTTTPRRSRWSARPSCSPTSAPRGP